MKAHSRTQVQQLWLMRTIMGMVIFAALLLLAGFLLPRKTASLPSKTCLIIARLSILLMDVGALMIGLARTTPAPGAGKSTPSRSKR